VFFILICIKESIFQANTIRQLGVECSVLEMAGNGSRFRRPGRRDCFTLSINDTKTLEELPMELSLLDFLIGFFLMNAMPHLLFGLLKIRFLSAFGFSPRGNVAYAFLNVAMALVLFHIQYDIQALMRHGIMIGAGVMLLLYLVSARFFYNLFQQRDTSH
jgi:hypothetical protein